MTERWENNVKRTWSAPSSFFGQKILDTGRNSVRPIIKSHDKGNEWHMVEEVRRSCR